MVKIGNGISGITLWIVMLLVGLLSMATGFYMGADIPCSFREQLEEVYIGESAEAWYIQDASERIYYVQRVGNVEQCRVCHSKQQEKKDLKRVDWSSLTCPVIELRGLEEKQN